MLFSIRNVIYNILMGCVESKCFYTNSELEAKNLTQLANKYKLISDGIWLQKASSNVITITPTNPFYNQHFNPLYIDTEFPPQQSSICTQDSALYNQLTQAKWLRPEEIYKPQFCIYTQQPSTSITRSFEIDDYLYLCLKYICQQTKISSLFISNEISATGQYAVRLYLNSALTYVHIDDNFLCSSNCIPVFAFNQYNNEIWALIIEKAFAKLYGSYSNLQKGNAAEAMKILTGAPTEAVRTIEKDIFTTINKCVKEKCLIYVNANPYSKLFRKNAMFLIYKVFQNGSTNVVKLFNPFEKAIDTVCEIDETKMTESLRIDMKSRDQQNGIFYINGNKFLENFSDINICRIYNDYVVSTTGFSHKQGEFAVIKMIVSENTNGFIYICLPTPGVDNIPFYDYYPVKINLWKMLQKDEYIFISSKTFESGNLLLFSNEKIDEGIYVVMFECKWEDKRNSILSFTAYANKEVKFEAELSGLDDMIEPLLKGICYTIKPSIPNQAEDSKIYEYYPMEGMPFGCIYITNATNDNIIYKIDFLDCSPIIFPPYNQMKSNIEINVNSNEDKMCILYCELPIKSKVTKLKKESKNPIYMINEQNKHKAYRFSSGEISNISLHIVKQLPNVSFVFSNRSKYTTLTAAIELVLVNLRTMDLGIEFDIVVRPNRNVVIETVVIDSKKEVSYDMKEKYLSLRNEDF